MVSEIPKVPEIPDKIVEAVNNKTLAIFIGAGVSRLFGCASWDQLAHNLVNRCFITKNKNGSKLMNYKEKDALMQNRDPKKTITICYNLLKKNELENIFYEEVEKSLKPDPSKEHLIQIYDELYRLRGLCITTNVDEHFDKKYELTQIVYREEDFDPSNIDRNRIYHIHGSIKDRNSIILTVPQYIKRYNKKNFKNFLQRICEEYTVLFVGYGLSEFELLDFLITKYDPDSEKELKHFILLPFYKGEKNIFEIEQFYYNSMGIKVLPYEKDEKGYEQLYEVIKKWNGEINLVTNYLDDTYREIEDAANNYTETNVERIFQIIKNDEPQKKHFFKKLESSPNPFPWLKPLKEKGYFDPVNNPLPKQLPDNEKLFKLPYWEVLGYLENVSAKNEKTPSEGISNILVEIIDQIINYRNEKGERIDNFITDRIIAKIIFSLPIDKINKEHIEFIRIALNSKWDTTLLLSEISDTILPKLVEKKAENIILQLLDIILDYRKIKKESVIREKENYEYKSVLDEYWLKEALKKNKPQIAKLLGLKAAELALKKITSILKEDQSQFNYFLVPTIEDHSQTTFPDRYECQIVYFVRDIFEQSKPQIIKEAIKNLLREDHPIFKRIAIHIINYHYRDLNELFWGWKDNPLEESQLKHELYQLFKNNCTSFSREQIDKILEWIENKNYLLPEEIKDDKDQVEKVLAYEKKEWLYALLDTKDSVVLSSYQKYDRINPAELKHPGFIFWMETKWGFESPVKEEEFLNKSNEEIAEYLINFKGNDRGIGIEDFSYIFRSYVSKNPEKFTGNINPFLKVPAIFQHALLWGFKEAWTSKKEINWEIIFNFISDLLGSEDFWNEEYYKNWIISRIAELIEDGTKDDHHAFNPDFLSQAERILLILVEKTRSDLPDIKDLITSVLNSPRGKIFSAMINYSLRYARLYKMEGEKRWVNKIKEDFSKRLNREIEPSLEFSVTLGNYLANLYWLDKKWVIDNINEIFPQHNDCHWKAAFSAYLFYSSELYKDIYLLLRKNKHYARALETTFGDFYLTEKLVQHICILYLEDEEKLEDQESLIFQLINNKNPDQLSAIVNYFWMQKNNLNNKIKNKVKPLWKILYEVTKDKVDTLEYQKIISSLSKWLSLVDEIDDEMFEWLKLSAKYVDKDYNSHVFVEYLLRHFFNKPRKVGEIYLEMLNAGTYPSYKKENIQNIVKTLFDQNEAKIARKICNLYRAKGFEFLKDIYETYRDDK